MEDSKGDTKEAGWAAHGVSVGTEGPKGDTWRTEVDSEVS
jgi:hypothetical protein